MLKSMIVKKKKKKKKERSISAVEAPPMGMWVDGCRKERTKNRGRSPGLNTHQCLHTIHTAGENE